MLQRSVLSTAANVHLAAAALVSDSSQPAHDPPLQPRDEAVFLLTAAAEVEHALMVQYLFAAYSVRIDSGLPGMEQIQDLLLQIAREEMGHLATVQNLLHALGGSLNFRREQSPYASEIYPFRFKLQPLTLNSLAKYVIAESPIELPADLSEDDQALLCDTIESQARTDNDSIPIQHVGPIFARLLWLLEEGDDRIRDEDFVTGVSALHARYDDWGYDPQDAAKGDPLVVVPLDGPSPAELREQAKQALRKIAEQGEGYDPPTGGGEMESHFERFFAIYKRLNELTMGGQLPSAWPLPVNPNTTEPPGDGSRIGLEKMVAMVKESFDAQGRITNRRSRTWAQLFNLRYRLLISFLSHFLRLGTPAYIEAGDNQGDRTPRGLLLLWTFNEMRRLRRIALKLVQLKKDDAGSLNAGPPFELPYTLSLPDHESARWRSHRDVSVAAVNLVEQLRVPGSPDEDDEFLADLVRLDGEMQSVLEGLASDGTIPVGTLPADLQKAVHILEEAVRGFSIGFHLNFWDRKNRDEFIDQGPFGLPAIKRNSDGSFDADNSAVVQQIERTDSDRMPRYRPAIPESRRNFLRQWITDGCPSDGGLGIEREREPKSEPPEPMAPPQANRPLSFAADIKTLFRETPDRSVMQVFGLDLHDHDQVSDRADLILSRLQDGSMPCDGSWPPERIARFEKWIADGKLP
jgi:rubrerythrin